MATTTLHLRIEEDDLKDFRALCAIKYQRDHNDQLRELIVAFNEGRIRIRPTAGQLNLTEDIYEDGK